MENPTCTIDGCGSAIETREYCSRHYRRVRKAERDAMPENRTCRVDECEVALTTRNRSGRCTAHYHLKNDCTTCGRPCAAAVCRTCLMSQSCLAAEESGVCEMPTYANGLCQDHAEERGAHDASQVRKRRVGNVSARDSLGRKRCPRCQEWKPEGEYHKNHRASDGLSIACNRCNKATVLKRTYGITIEDFDRILESQGHACAVCRAPHTEDAKLHVDHDHACCPQKAGSCGSCVRALICSKCNLGLGAFADDPERLEAAAAYLRKHAA